jgi:hypothetical protein
MGPAEDEKEPQITQVGADFSKGGGNQLARVGANARPTLFSS